MEISFSAKYQFIILGNRSLSGDIVDLFKLRVSELGVEKVSLNIITDGNLVHWQPSSPTVALYFGNDLTHPKDLAQAQTLISAGRVIIPIVSSITRFSKETPLILQGINGIALDDSSKESIVGLVLEGLGLIRSSRRLFISYKRSESTEIAIQLYEELDSMGFNVFLDTHSVPKGHDFQEELWHNLADSDVIVLLDTPGFRKSKWSSEELARASAMSIGIYQLIWPGHMPKADSAFIFSRLLEHSDFSQSTTGKALTINRQMIEIIKNEIESLRARNLAARQQLLIRSFVLAANESHRTADLQPMRYINYIARDLSESVVIPMVGIPHAHHFHDWEGVLSKLVPKKAKIFVLYDNLNVKNSWQEHLYWLNKHLPVQSVKVTEIDQWISKN